MWRVSWERVLLKLVDTCIQCVYIVCYGEFMCSCLELQGIAHDFLFWWSQPLLSRSGRNVGIMMPKFQRHLISYFDWNVAKLWCYSMRLMKGSFCFPCHVRIVCRACGQRNPIIYKALVGLAYVWWERTLLWTWLELVVWGQIFLMTKVLSSHVESWENIGTSYEPRRW